jgi:hypothetical protein
MVTIIKISRLKWLGHVNKMENYKQSKRAQRVFMGVEGEDNQERGGWITWKMNRGRLELNVGE